MRPEHIQAILLPGDWTRSAIVTSQKFKIQNIDDTIIVQVCGGGCGGVIAHAQRHGIELIDHIIAVNIASQQANGGHGIGAAAC